MSDTPQIAAARRALVHADLLYPISDSALRGPYGNPHRSHLRHTLAAHDAAFLAGVRAGLEAGAIICETRRAEEARIAGGYLARGQVHVASAMAASETSARVLRDSIRAIDPATVAEVKS